jgi:aspartate aminotransferase
VVYAGPVPSLLELPDPNQKHIVVNGFSKAFAMSGWRIGYLITPYTLFAACLQFQKATFSGVSELVQAAARQVLQYAPEIMADFNHELRQNRETMSQFFQPLQVPFSPPPATYFLFPDLTAYLRKTVTSTQQLAHYLKENYALEIMPGDYFGAPGYVRLSFALSPKDLEEGLNRLQKALATLL